VGIARVQHSNVRTGYEKDLALPASEAMFSDLASIVSRRIVRDLDLSLARFFACLRQTQNDNCGLFNKKYTDKSGI